MKLVAAACIFFFSCTLSIHAQNPTVQINRDNRTIAVTAEESAEAKAELAVLRFGYHNFAPTKEAAYEENVRVAERNAPHRSPLKVLNLPRIPVVEFWPPYRPDDVSYMLLANTLTS